MVMPMVKSVTSASISMYSGISMPSRRPRRFASFSRLSRRPGKATPATMVFDPSEMIRPLVTLTFLKCSGESSMPLAMTNGTQTFRVTPLTVTGAFV